MGYRIPGTNRETIIPVAFVGFDKNLPKPVTIALGLRAPVLALSPAPQRAR
jgi:hypothetical protein